MTFFSAPAEGLTDPRARIGASLDMAPGEFHGPAVDKSKWITSLISPCNHVISDNHTTASAPLSDIRHHDLASEKETWANLVLLRTQKSHANIRIPSATVIEMSKHIPRPVLPNADISAQDANQSSSTAACSKQPMIFHDLAEVFPHFFHEPYPHVRIHTEQPGLPRSRTPSP